MINISDNSLLVLKKCIKEHKPSLLAELEDFNHVKHEINFYNELRQIVGNELILKGFNENYEPNEYGITLEKLIDEIGRLFM